MFDGLFLVFCFVYQSLRATVTFIGLSDGLLDRFQRQLNFLILLS